MISAEVICDSVNEQDNRLTTFKLRYPKFIHGEFMTHRVISRNASSSRAIPTARLIEEVRSDALRAGPVFWGANQKGMQAAEELSDTEPSVFGSERSAKDQAQYCWQKAALSAAGWADNMVEAGVHKQIVNRLLEPFSHINVIATATEWDNFFGLRLHKDAQPEMRALAIAMWEARKASTPKLLKPGEWHLPFVDDKTLYSIAAKEVTGDETLLIPDRPFERERLRQFKEQPTDTPIKVSTARCARVSYESFETGKRSTVEEDLKLYDRLLGAQPLHASPAEHQATPDEQFVRTIRHAPKTTGGCFGHGERTGYVENSTQWSFPHQWGNFIGWRQNRKLIPNEAIAPLPEEYR